MARTIQIGKRRWVAGMTWSSYEDAPSKDELKDDAARLGASWTCVRVSESAIQAGFCSAIDGAKEPKKLFSLAAMLADSREQPWLGIFKIAEGLWWYIAVRDGHAILPDGDVIGGETEIHAARDRHSGYTDWKYIEGDISLLEAFIDDIDAKPTPVRSLSGSGFQFTPLILSALVVTSLAGGGYWWWHQQQLNQERERLAAMARVRAQLAAGQAVALIPSPLLTTPHPNNWLAVCSSVISALPMSHNGWALDQVSCSAASSMAYWVRKDGATVANKPEGDLSPEGDAVSQMIPLVGLKAQGTNEAVDLPAAKLALRAWAQAAGFTLNMTEVAQTPALPGQPVAAAETRKASVLLDVSVSPFDFDMSSIPGLRLTGLKSTATGWHLEGTLYGR